MILRAARPAESGVLTALVLRSKAHWGYDAAFLEACRAELVVTPAAIERGDVVVAEQDGVLLGMSGLHLTAEPPELDMLFVDAGATGRGIGAALLADACRRACAAGVTELRIESDRNAEPFYLAQGARRIGARASTVDGHPLPLLVLATAG